MKHGGPISSKDKNPQIRKESRTEDAQIEGIKSQEETSE